MALNSDASIRSYKGEKRPIINLENRLQMISSLGFVDYVTYFEESTPCSVLSMIKPDVHINGAEYGKKCIEAKVVEENGGKLHIIELIPGLSTTEVIHKIKNS